MALRKAQDLVITHCEWLPYWRGDATFLLISPVGKISRVCVGKIQFLFTVWMNLSCSVLSSGTVGRGVSVSECGSLNHRQPDRKWKKFVLQGFKAMAKVSCADNEATPCHNSRKERRKIVSLNCKTQRNWKKYNPLNYPFPLSMWNMKCKREKLYNYGI